MKKEFSINIPEPCSEKWEDFKPTTHGGFCSSCQKEVIDFTLWSEERIKAYFKNKPLNTCGRFKRQQLKTYTYEQPRWSLPGWVPASLVSSILLLSSTHSEAQVKGKTSMITQHEELRTLQGDTLRVITHVKLTGIVKDGTDSVAMPGVNVMRKGTKDGTTTDAQGRFTLELENPAFVETVTFSFIGMITVEKEFNITEAETNTSVIMHVDDVALNEVVLVGGIVSYKWYNPKRYWWRVRSWFTR